MKIKQHADNTERLFGYRAEDIHKWIDHYFDKKRFNRAVRRGFLDGWNPYEHRKYLHNIEALPDAVDTFREDYPEDVIEKVFLQHLKDDYRGYVPCKADFEKATFRKKYHRPF